MQKLVAILAFLVITLSPTIASADPGPGTYNGGGGVPSPLSALEVQRNQLKSDFATAYMAHRRAGGTPANFPGGLSTLEQKLNGGASFGIAFPAAYPAQFSSNSLGSPTYQAQETNFYCGPASAWVALKYRGAANNIFGAPLIQTNLGTSYWLNTTDPAGTGRGSNWTHTLNGWTDGSDGTTGWYVVANYGYADAASVADKFAANIDNSHAPIMNIYMNSTPARGWLPGWSGYTEAWHYVPGFGYSQYGDYLNYIEVFGPATTGYKYNITKEFFAKLITDMGMIW